MCNAWLAVALCLCARAPDFQVCYAAGQCRRDGAVGYGLVWRGIEVTLVLIEASSTPVRQSKGPTRRVSLKPGVLDIAVAAASKGPGPTSGVMVC
jgi:hypothetical protein